jgi:hypothetical protein
MSLLSCIDNPLRIEVYPDESGWGQGYIYLDDGETLDYQHKSNSHAWIQMTWTGNSLYLTNIASNNYEFPLTQRVTSVAVYGIETAPALVTGGMYEIPYVYDPAIKAVFTSGFAFELNQGLTVNLVWN